jgi:hypothetical protein
VLVELAATSAARASAPSESDLAAARALFADAILDEQAGRWAEALGKIRRASTVKMTPGLRFHIALCEERTGHLVAALDDYSAAQAAARAENNREVLALASDPLLSLKVRMPTVSVRLPSDVAPSDAETEVRLDGAVLAPASVGLPVPVDVGTHTIQARGRGQTPYAMTFTVVERQAATVDVHFKPLPGAGHSGGALVPTGAATGAVAGASTGAAAATPSAASPAAIDTPAQHPASSHAAAIAATVSAAALAGLGVAAYAVAGSDQSYWVGVCRTQPQPCGNATPVRAWDAAALSSFIAAGGAAVAAGILWARPATSTQQAARVELAVGVGSFAVVGQF